MNHKETLLDKIVEIVARCTSYDIDGKPTITADDLLGSSRAENHVMARALLALQLTHEGYSTTTIALKLHRSEQAIRKLVAKGYNYVASSRACRKAAAEIVLECDKVFGETQ